MSQFPSSLPSFTNLIANQTLAANNHTARHNDVHAELIAIATRLGITGSLDTSSIEYRLTDLRNDFDSSATPGNSIISDEAVTGAQNGTNKTYTTAQTYIGGSLEVFINGLKQTRGVHLTENTPTTFTLDTAPVSTDLIRVNYLHTANTGSQDADTLDGYHALGIFNQLYPVGTVYINATNSANPATLLGFGTWVAWGVGKAIVGIDSTQTEFDTAEETGGAKTVTLTTAQMPSHVHTMGTIQRIGNAGNVAAGALNLDDFPGSDGPISATNQPIGTGWTGTMGSAGSDGAHNNLQPYQVGYVWKRTA
jgi:hypothetical protein